MIEASSIWSPDKDITSSLPTDLDGKWYVAHTRSRNEKALSKELGRLRILHYLPLAPRMTRSPRTRRISRAMVPVFPGYVFFNASEEQRYAALRTNRIANVLTVPDQDQLVAELTNIHHLLVSTSEFSVLDRLNVGEWGRILTGPLAGLEGVVTQVNNRWRLCMNVTILGQSVSTEVDRSNVERIDPPSTVRSRAV